MSSPTSTRYLRAPLVWGADEGDRNDGSTTEQMLEAFDSLPDRLDLGYSDDDTLRTNNQVRASWAADAVATYARNTGIVRESAWTALSDLLNDARHLCDALGIDWDDVARPYDYEAEIRGEL